MKLQPKKWSEFQHYKDRSPPWIKLQKSLLDDYEFQSLHVASRALAPMLWLLASESTDGIFDANLDRLAFRLRADRNELMTALKELISKGFFVVASDMIAEWLHGAMPETETETETETESLSALQAKTDPVNRLNGKTAMKADGFSFPTALLEAGGNPDLVADWLKVRAKLKATNTKSAFSLFMREVGKAGYTVDQALEVCCSRSWKGFDADWVKDSRQADADTRPKLDTSLEARRAAMQAQADESYKSRAWLDGEKRYRTVFKIEDDKVTSSRVYDSGVAA